jgi:serine protease AprX
MKNLLILLIFITSLSGFSQDEDAIVYFNAKPNSAAFFSNPSIELSARSLARRTVQNIPLNFSDAPMSSTFIAQVEASAGVAVLAKSKWLNCVYVRGLSTNITALNTLPFVQNIKFLDNSLNLGPVNTEISFDNKISRPKNDISLRQNNTVFNYGGSFNQIHMSNGDFLHQQNFTGAGKIIAVLDSGFPGVNTALPFQRIINNNQILGGYDFVNDDNDYFSGDTHGTLVLSCMAGFVSGQLVGTAPDAQYYLYQTEDNESDSPYNENPVEEANWVEAAEEADRVGVDIITTSLGYFGYENSSYSHVYDDMIGDKNFASKGLNIAFSKGIICVVSAGNAGGSSEPHCGIPAEANNALAIGAVRSDRARVNFSSVGPTFDGRIKPDLMAQGVASIVSYPDGTIGTANGTSFSGPIMAGMIASFWQAVPTLTNQQVIDLVRQSADNFANPNNEYGYGIPNFQLALSNSLSNENFDTKDNKNFVLAPNPVNDVLEIFFPSGINAGELSIFNALGQNVFQNNISDSNSKILINNFNSGIYYYTIATDNYYQTGKIIKN